MEINPIFDTYDQHIFSNSHLMFLHSVVVFIVCGGVHHSYTDFNLMFCDTFGYLTKM